MDYNEVIEKVENMARLEVVANVLKTHHGYAKAQGRAMLRHIIMDRIESGESSVLLKYAVQTLDGMIAQHGSGNINGYEYANQILTPYNIAALIQEINAEEPFFAIGISEDGFTMDQERLIPIVGQGNEDNAHMWLPRAHNGTAAVLVFTDEDERYFGLDAHKVSIRNARLDGGIRSANRIDQKRAATLPSSPDVQGIAGTKLAIERVSRVSSK